MNVTVYSTTTCPYCNMLKDYLNESNISYVEKLIDQDEQAKEEMMQASDGFLGVPFTVIEKDGVKNTVIGFDKHRIDQLLEN